jgi:hypothetical protein
MVSAALPTYRHWGVPSENYRGIVAGPNPEMQIEARHSHGSGVAGFGERGDL